jgi:hypothetical protein
MSETVTIPADDEEIIVETAEVPAETTLDEGVEDLKRKLVEADNRVREAETARRAAEAREQRAGSEVEDVNRTLVETAITQLKDTRAQLTSKYAAALSIEDFDAAAGVMAEMTTSAAQLQDLERGRAAMESRSAEPKRPARGGDIEQTAAALPPRAAEWVRRYPDTVATDANKNRLIAAHHLALSEGHSAETDGYFDSIERHYGIRKSEPAPQAPASAPVSRGEQAARGSSRTTVTLSADEQEVARMNGMTYQQYAKNKQELAKQGKLH